MSENALDRLQEKRGLVGVIGAALEARDLYDDGIVCECDVPILVGYALMCRACLRENLGQRERKERAMREPHPFKLHRSGSGMCAFCSAWEDDPRHLGIGSRGPMPEPAPTRREPSKSVPVGEPPTPEGWTIPDEVIEAAAKAITDFNSHPTHPIVWDDLPEEVVEPSGLSRGATRRTMRKLFDVLAEQGFRVAPVGGAGVEETTVLDGYFATGDYECFVFDKHEGPAGLHDDGCRVYPDDLVPEGSKRKRGRWTISIRFEPVGEGDEDG